MTPEAQSELETLRAKITAGTYTADDLRTAVAIMREGRVIAAAASATSRKKKAATAAKKAPINADDLLAGLDSL